MKQSQVFSDSKTLTTEQQHIAFLLETEAKSEEALAGDAKLNEVLGSPDQDYLILQYDQGKEKAMGSWQ